MLTEIIKEHIKCKATKVLVKSNYNKVKRQNKKKAPRFKLAKSMLSHVNIKRCPLNLCLANSKLLFLKKINLRLNFKILPLKPCYLVRNSLWRQFKIHFKSSATTSDSPLNTFLSSVSLLNQMLTYLTPFLNNKRHFFIVNKFPRVTDSSVTLRHVGLLII